MNHSTKGGEMVIKYPYFYFVIVLFFSTSREVFGTKTFFSPRSKSFDVTAPLVGTRYLTSHMGQQENHSLLSWSVSYDQSFKAHDIARYFFGSSSVTFSGSRYPQRAATDFLADYFGLSTTACSHVCFNPEVDQFTNDFYWRLELDAVASGLYLSVRLPIVHAVWDLQMSERIIDQGVGHPAGYMSPARTELANTAGVPLNHTLAASVKEFFSGMRHTQAGDVVPLIVGDIQPLHYGKIAKRQTATRLSDVVISLGYEFLRKRRWSFGGNVRVGCNTACSSQAEYLFEAIVGNGGHWELGAGLTADVDIWYSSHANHAISLHIDAQGSYLFAAKQRRSFDLHNRGSASRYMLLQQFGNPSQDLFLGSSAGAASPYQYEGRLIPAINATTLDIKTSVPFQGEIAIAGIYEYKNSSLEIGYDFFGRIREHNHGRDCFPADTYALKGDAQLYGFDALDMSFALAATENSATIHAGQGATNFVTGASFANENVDTPVIAANSAVILNNLTAADAADYGGLFAVHTSATPVLLSDADINVGSGLLPWSLSHRIFVHVSHYWDYDDFVTPFLGIGGAIEWAHGDSREVSLLNQWSIALKGGVWF